jgi:CheY-like chemotaxis protein
LTRKILVIDDNKEITDLVQEILSSPTYNCVAVNNGEEGLALLKKQDFDLVLLDRCCIGMEK